MFASEFSKKIFYFVYDTLGGIVGCLRQLYISTTYGIFLYSIALLCWLCAAITPMYSFSPDLWQGYVLWTTYWGKERE